jgi:hypothetical protein
VEEPENWWRRRMKEMAMKVASATMDGRGAMVVMSKGKTENSFSFRIHITAFVPNVLL